MNDVRISALSDLGDFRSGDDLAGIIAAALQAQLVAVEEGTIVVVAQKIISKVEGRLVDLNRVQPSAKAIELAETTRKDPALVELVLQESTDIVRACPGVLIVRHRNGYVMANAGIDASNLEPVNDQRQVLLLPIDSDQSAELLKQQLEALLGVRLAVVVSDSFGRPWRHGVTNVAIGAAGLPAIIDRRKELDRYGRTLEVTQIAVADLLASAAGLLMGEANEGKPVIIIQGMRLPSEKNCPATSIVRPLEEDLFR